jgi:hypothetical protein
MRRLSSLAPILAMIGALMKEPSGSLVIGLDCESGAEVILVEIFGYSTRASYWGKRS